MNVYTIVGLIVTACACTIVTVGAVVAAWSYIDWRLEKRRDFLRWVEARRIGNEIVSASWWFGESPDGREILRLLGTSLMENATFDAGRVRDEWRAQRDAKECGHGGTA